MIFHLGPSLQRSHCMQMVVPLCSIGLRMRWPLTEMRKLIRLYNIEYINIFYIANLLPT